MYVIYSYMKCEGIATIDSLVCREYIMFVVILVSMMFESSTW